MPRLQIRLGWSFEADRPWGYYAGQDLRLVSVEADGLWLGRGGVVCVGWFMGWWLRPVVFVEVAE